jgi:selenocysteine lyase/cysteine desulfurase
MRSTPAWRRFSHTDGTSSVPEVDELEKKLAAFTGATHCITVANGTDALQIALMALGVGRGDEVVTPSFSFIATAEAPVVLGARPVFVDIDPVTFNIDVAALDAAITPRTKAIIPVSLYGQPADFDSINEIAARHGVPVIEDGAQSFGASYRGREVMQPQHCRLHELLSVQASGVLRGRRSAIHLGCRSGCADAPDSPARSGEALSPCTAWRQFATRYSPGGHSSCETTILEDEIAAPNAWRRLIRQSCQLWASQCRG